MIRVHHRFMTGSGDVMHLRFQGMEKSTPNKGDYAYLLVFKSPKSEATIGQVVWENLWRRALAVAFAASLMVAFYCAVSFFHISKTHL